jgi:hypothetical protein
MFTPLRRLSASDQKDLMRVEALKLTLRLPYTTSLKDKRRILKSILTRSKNDFPISISEVDMLDDFRTAIIGISMVSSDAKLNESLLRKLTTRIDNHNEIELVEEEQDFLYL